MSAVAQPARARLTTYVGDVAALVRKDLLLEMRARETVPAMLLFVVSALTVFHFAVPEDLEPATEEAVAKGLLWIAILFTALLGLARAFAAEREQDVLDGLVLAPSDRSAIWLSKTVTVTAFLVLMEIVALPVFALLYAPLDAATIGAVLLADIGIAAVGLAALGDGAREPDRRADPASALPPARGPHRRRRSRRLHRRRPCPLRRLPRPLRRHLCDHLVGRL